jgi:hypothetical protein
MAEGANPIDSSSASGASAKSQVPREKAKLFLDLCNKVKGAFGEQAFNAGYSQLVAGMQYVNPRSTVEVNEEKGSVKIIDPETNKPSATFIFDLGANDQKTEKLF